MLIPTRTNYGVGFIFKPVYYCAFTSDGNFYCQNSNVCIYFILTLLKIKFYKIQYNNVILLNLDKHAKSSTNTNTVSSILRLLKNKPIQQIINILRSSNVWFCYYNTNKYLIANLKVVIAMKCITLNLYFWWSVVF